jgi:hypothetical protein
MLLSVKATIKAIPSSVDFYVRQRQGLFNRFNTVGIYKIIKIHLETLIYGFRNDGNVCIQLCFTSAEG